MSAYFLEERASINGTKTWVVVSKVSSPWWSLHPERHLALSRPFYNLPDAQHELRKHRDLEIVSRKLLTDD